MKDRVRKIYRHAIDILEQVGVKLKHDRVLDILQDNGVRIEGDPAFFTQKDIEVWIAKAPSSFTLHARNPEYNAFIGGDRINFTAGYGCPTVYELDGSARAARLSDYLRFARLIHQCDHFSINGGILAQPSNVPAVLSHLIMTYAALMASDKCLMGLPGNESQMRQIMELAAIAFGGREALKEKPHILTMISTISPLLVDDMALSSILVAAEFNQPLIISPGPGAGTTGPIDLAGNMALATAEALACIVVAQMIKPGVPVLFGLQCFGADLKTANVSIGSPAYAQMARHTAELARYLDLPSRCGGSNTDALCVSPQSGYEGMLSLLTACQNKVNLMVQSTGILDSFAAISYEKFIVDLEIIDMVTYYLDDFEISSNTLNLDLIKAVGPGGNFLITMDTTEKCRTHSWTPRVGVRGKIDRKAVLDKYYDNIQTTINQMLDDYQQPQIDPAIRSELDNYMMSQGVDRKFLADIHDLINS